ncbi:MAG TPA: pilus assembly protein PilP [Anaeromyxobacteraceae bacterium]|nr:pilus assembly protein PilP [Anaeromyxobacteraceae bacterium]
MSRRALVAVLAIVAIAACGEKKQQARRTAPVDSGAKPAAGPGTAKGPEVEVPYSSVGKRDPFKSFVADLRATSGPTSPRCRTALGRYELDQLRLVAVVTGLADPVAMVEVPTGVGYSIRKGSCMGKNGGVVAAIRSGEVVVTEWILRADGTQEKAQSVLRLPRDQSLNLEE